MNTRANAAFYYISEGYETNRRTLMGRQAAGEGFLKGFAKHSAVNSFYCYGPTVEQFNFFQRSITQATGKEDTCSFIPFEEYPRLSEVGCLFVPGPNISKDAWVRRSLNNRAYSICGVTHTTATEKIMDSIGALLTDPVQSWDAIVCTSSVVKKTLERVINSYADYLEDRMGVRPTTPIQLPIIPLGVDCEQFSILNRESYRTFWRNKLGIADGDIAVLFMGRLSFAAKAHPIPMFLALEEAARRSGKKICLLLAGWVDHPAAEDLWKHDVQKYCPSVKVVFLDGRQGDIRREIWSAADIFTSLSDNIQETFGLTPIEAMAAGLPVVVTDWNGYRDTIRHGVDGFRVPVSMPAPGAGEDLAIRFANQVDSYGKYCGTVSQMTSVDIAACFISYMTLIENKELRFEMGNAGRKRAQAEYDWSKVVKQYQGLWEILYEKRQKGTEIVPKKNGKAHLPLRMDPFMLFQEYPSAHITENSLVTLQAGIDAAWYKHILSSRMNNFAMNLLLPINDQIRVIDHLSKSKADTIGNIAQLLSIVNKGLLLRTVGWMCKYGIVAINEATRNI